MRRILRSLSLSLALLGSATAAAQSSPSPQQASPSFQFDIPAGDLSTAVQKFAATIGGDAIFDAYAARTARTQPVRGQMTPEAALNQMLAGTGLYYHYNASSRRVVVAKR